MFMRTCFVIIIYLLKDYQINKYDNQNYGDESNGPILWGLSFALASAIAFKTVGALFPRRKTDGKYGDEIEKVTQINTYAAAVQFRRSSETPA
ncbi:hypothetical protein P3S67_026868 [Capsicum chacoense]